MPDCASSKHPLTNAGFSLTSHCIKQPISVHKTKQLISWRLKINMQGAGIETAVLKYTCLMPRLVCKFISSVILTKSCWCVFTMVKAKKQIIFRVQLNAVSYWAMLWSGLGKGGCTEALCAAEPSSVRSNPSLPLRQRDSDFHAQDV